MNAHRTIVDMKIWKEKNEDLFIDETTECVDCSECHGTGELVCNLGHEHMCDECEGSGIDSEIDTAPILFEKQIIADIMKLQRNCPSFFNIHAERYEKIINSLGDQNEK